MGVQLQVLFLVSVLNTDVPVMQKQLLSQDMCSGFDSVTPFREFTLDRTDR